MDGNNAVPIDKNVMLRRKSSGVYGRHPTVVRFHVHEPSLARSAHPYPCMLPIVMALLLMVSVSLNASAKAAGDLMVSGLRCEGVISPLGIEALHPKLSWHLEARAAALRGVRQTAYRILAASTLECLTERDADLWDSAKVTSAANAWIPYGGHALPPATRCWWKVQVWDQQGRSSGWSRAAHWDTGLIREADWGAQWIGARVALEAEGAPCFRKAFVLRPGWRTVRAFVCGLGYHEFYINGKKADRRVLEPAQTEYPKRVFYSAYDVTGLVKAGDNVLGVMLGNGWYNQDRVWGGMSYGHPVLRLRFEAEYPDGTRQAVRSDDTWQVAAGPVVANNIYAGETYDARRVLDWNGATMAGKPWSAVMPVQGPAGALTCPALPPIRAVRTLTPPPPREVAPGVLLYDMRQNFAGWARLRVQAPAGTTLKMRFAETVDPKTGLLDTASTGVFATQVEQIDTYICRGGGLETWEPSFTYHGYRYVEVTGLPAGLRPPALEGIVVHTDVEPAGGFTCSDPMLNRIHAAAVWTLVSNLHGVPTDCPARERCGWLGDSHAAAEMAALNFDMSGFWSKYIDDIQAGWVSDLPPHVVPGKRIAVTSGPIDWGVAIVMLPWFHWLYYGDQAELERCYPAMSRFVRTAARGAANGIASNGLGDWCPPGSVEPTATPVPLTTTAWLIEAARRTSQTAALLEHPEEAAEFAQIAERSAAALRAKYYDATAHTFGSQTADALALAFHFCPPTDRQAVADSLARDVVKHGSHHTTGIFGSRWLFDTLTAGGHGDLALAVLQQTDYPSIGYLFGLGATTFWECWGEPELDKKWGARSLNHPMQAGYDAWFFQGPGGITCDEAGSGFRRIIVRPNLLPGLKFVRTYHDSPQGRIRSEWSREGDAVRFHIVIPPNTTARLYLPLPQGQSRIMESGRSVEQSPGVKRLPDAEGCALFLAGSGDYSFTVQ
jgi:alpha-L-rhamnosidase